CPDGRHVATAGTDAAVLIWEAGTGKVLHRLAEQGAGISSLAVSPDGKVLAVGTQNGMVHLWDAAAGTKIRQLDRHPGYVLGLAFSRDGRTLAVGSWMTLRLWEVATGK